ncbi:hypothetical protein SAMN04244553_3579 [Nocardia amikacinitolerans]|uniref:Uncharacterized protein n=1 Tax=Nocardia amikacinitolerans TaxID=756689 RepID=A0A285LG41_9NOCA|nr:hypothetical protein [Nocardia amikacinitolerans]SNY83928.1 hypothetical protein SAMN04244553_3579 [Nocardia amikacinitolerans]
MSEEPEIVESVSFPAADAVTSEAPRYRDINGIGVTDKFIAFMQQALHGRLPELGEVAEADPQIRYLAEELTVVHLPEWRNPAGRKLADPTVTSIKGAPRLADYLFQRGWRHHPELEQIRWVPTPGGPPGPYDTGLHVTPDENGEWPMPDPEEFYDIDDIDVRQLEDGTWAAAHPRGLAFQAPTKSEAYAGLVEKIRTKIKEARDGVEG